MGKINVLGFEIANLIAAGEVVDRPSSVVKELLENAVDSGATAVTVEIRNGGVDFIRVSDNGSGMEAEDLPVAVKRHATSKISGAEDLDHIMTLGFRGEALAAISSVTRLRIFSKTRESEMGALLESEGGEVVSLTETGCADGTTVLVEDLFFNTPARKKFLKKPSTEAATVAALLEKLALSVPAIAVKLIVDGEVRFSTTGDGSLHHAVYAVLGRDVARKMIAVKRAEGGVTVEGFTSSPMLVRANRNMENFFINSRYVKTQTAAAAIEQAYESYIPQEKFPACVLNITVDPSRVDVNVHPSKLEVKFSEEKVIFDAVFYAVRTALESSIARPELHIAEKQVGMQRKVDNVRNPQDALVPEKFREKTPEVHTEPIPVAQSEPQPFSQRRPLPFLEPPSTMSPKPEVIRQESSQSALSETVPELTRLLHVPDTPEPAEERKAEPTPLPDYIILGEAYNSYIIVQLEDKLLLIDKHAAHERILFEKLKAAMHAAKRVSQLLLMPVTAALGETEAAAVVEYANEIRAAGFDFTVEGTTIHITEVPDGIDTAAAHDMMCEFATQLAEGTGAAGTTRDLYFEKALYQASCKAAIKAGRVYEPEHIRWLCDTLLSLDEIKVCPHGRPVAFELTKTSIERQFKRIN